jgi:transcriptional regulator with XRE-family HTH domain
MTNPVRFGAELRRLRTVAGLPLSVLAKRVHYSPGHLSRIEAGLKRPHPDLVRMLDAALGAGGSLIGLFERIAPVRELARPSVPPPGDADMIGGLRDDPAAVDSHQRLFTSLRAAGRQLPAALLAGPVRQSLSVLEQAAELSHGTQRCRLLQLAARYAEFLGWMLQEQGAVSPALYWTNHAVVLAGAGGDPGMAGHALVRRSLFTLYAGSGQDTVELAGQALAGPDPSPRLRHLALLRQAQGHALAMDAAATAAALRAAEAAVPGQTAVDDLTLGPTAVAQWHAVTEAWCLVELGEVRRAAELFDDQVARIPETNRRSRARFGIRRALAHAMAGEIEQACVAAGQVMPDVRAVRSATVGLDVERLRRTVVRWHRHAPVHELTSDLDAVLNHQAGTSRGEPPTVR